MTSLELKYIYKDSLEAFLIGMGNYETSELLNDLNVLDLLEGKTPTGDKIEVPPYEAAEAFLYMFQEREDYELCQMLIEKWPNLKKK